MNNKEILIFFGFLVEIFIFAMVGIFFIFMDIPLMLITLSCGVFWAYLVGKLVEKNAIEKWKWGLYK